MSLFRKLITSATLLAASAATGQAGPLTRGDEDDSAWRYDLTLYAFLPLRSTGTSTVAGQSAPVDLSLRDVLEVLNFALSGRFEAWKGNFGAILDANYYELEEDATLPGPLASPVNVNVRQKWLGIYGAYRVANGLYGQDGRAFSVDLQAGARYNRIKQEITITSPLPIPALGGDEGWWEPVVGARGVWELSDNWTGVAMLELGGFGAGGNDLQVGANILAEYSRWERTSLVMGYRYFSMDYSTTLDTGTMAYDVEQHGPTLGVKVKF